MLGIPFRRSVLLLMPVLCLTAFAPLCAQTFEWTTQDSVLLRRLRGTSITTYIVTFHNIECSDTLHCTAIGYNGGTYNLVHRTDDGGRTWRTVFMDSAVFGSGREESIRFEDIATPSPDLCVVLGDSGLVLRSADGCRSWQRIDIGTKSNSWGIDMLDSSNGVLIGSGRRILHTTDGGATWDSVPAPAEAAERGYSLQDVAMPDPASIVVSASYHGDCAMYHTSDLGRTWTRAATGCGFSRLFFVDSLYGWGCGYEPFGPRQEAYDVVARTTDGGRSWRRVLRDSIHPAFGLWRIAFADRRHGIATGLGGKIIVTSDGGESWRAENVPSTYAFNIPGVAYPSLNHVWLVTVTSQMIHGTPRIVSGVGREQHADARAAAIHPNPAGGLAWLEYTLRTAGRVTIDIWNSLGQQMRTVQDAVEGQGQYTLRLPAEDLPPGMYFVSVRHPDNVELLPFVVGP